MLLRLAILSFVLVPRLTLADLTQDECPDKDASNCLSLSHDQHPSKWCHIYASADLISCALSQDGKIKVSPMDVAAASFTATPETLDRLSKRLDAFDSRMRMDRAIRVRNPEQTVEYGQPFRERGGLTSVDILAYNAREGYCDAAAMPTGEHSVLQNPRQKAADPAVRQWKPRAGRKLDWLAQLGRASSDDVPKLAGSPQLPLACDNPNQLIASFDDARRTANQAVLSTLNEEINNRCRPRHPMPFLAPNTSGFDPDGVKGSEKTYAAKLLSKYLAGGQPASVDLYDFFLQRTAIPRKDSLHAVVVVGMRWNRRKSRCEFKVHNSWGATCDKYSDKFRKKDVCDKGDVWIEESLIRAQVVTMTTIEKVEMNGSKK